MAKATQTRGVGRPANFPGQKTVAFLANIPVETREMIRDLATKRGENIGVVVDAMIRRSFKEATRRKTKAKAK